MHVCTYKYTNRPPNPHPWLQLNWHCLSTRNCTFMNYRARVNPLPDTYVHAYMHIYIYIYIYIYTCIYIYKLGGQRTRLAAESPSVTPVELALYETAHLWITGFGLTLYPIHMYTPMCIYIHVYTYTSVADSARGSPPNPHPWLQLNSHCSSTRICTWRKHIVIYIPIGRPRPSSGQPPNI